MSESQQGRVPPNEPGGRAFIGRSPEMDQLRAAMAQAESGRGQIALLAGEPGIGKTRIAQEFSSVLPNACGQLWREHFNWYSIG